MGKDSIVLHGNENSVYIAESFILSTVGFTQ